MGESRVHTGTESVDIVVVCRRKILWPGILCDMRDPFPSITTFKENSLSDIFDDRGNSMYVARLDTRKHDRRDPLLLAIKVIQSSRLLYVETRGYHTTRKII